MRKLFATCTALLLGFTACDGKGDPAGPDEEEPRDPVTFTVTGQGAVAERYTAEIAVSGDWAYTSTWGTRIGVRGTAIKIWNVAGGTVTLRDSLIIADVNTIGDIQVSPDGRLLMAATEYVTPGSIVLFDRTDPAKPVQVARFSSANTAQGVHTAKFGTVNGRLYAFLSIDPGATPAKLVIVDLSNPAAPQEVLAQNMGRPFVHDVFVRDGLLFTALWDDGLTIWDIGGGSRGGTPAAPVQISNVKTATGDIHNVWWFHDRKTGSKKYVFLGEEGPGSVGGVASGDIHVIDISDIAQPREVAIYSVPGAGTHNFWADEQNGYLYAAYYNAGVRALDARGDLGSCTAAQKTVAGLCDLRLMRREAGFGLTTGSYVWGVVHQGTTLYASDMLNGIFRLDASGLVRN